METGVQGVAAKGGSSHRCLFEEPALTETQETARVTATHTRGNDNDEDHLAQISMLHDDLNERIVIDTNSIPWVKSPRPGIWRRMLERQGLESGRATSIVRYEAGSQFPWHEHPLGEEFLVLDGVFSDEHGDYPAGTFVLNPPGSSHAPESRDGCSLFVKLCQYAGPGRGRFVVETRRIEWRVGPVPGIWVKELYSEAGHPEYVALLKWEPGARYPSHVHRGGEEVLVLEGALVDEAGFYPSGTWIRNPPMSAHEPFSPKGCLLLVKTGGL